VTTIGNDHTHININNKLTTPVKLKQRKVSWAPTDTKCTFEGCNQEEDLEHILSCPFNPKLTDEQPILDILNKIDPTYLWTHREMWYSHPPRRCHLPHEALREKIYKEGKTMGNKGFIPPDITQLIEKKCGKDAKETIRELQKAILTRAKTIWGFRCKVFFEKRAIERILRKEEEEEKKREEEERVRKEMLEREEQKRKREEERRKMLYDPKCVSRRMKRLRKKRKENIYERMTHARCPVPTQAFSATVLPTPQPPPTQPDEVIPNTRSETRRQGTKRIPTHTNTPKTAKRRKTTDSENAKEGTKRTTEKRQTTEKKKKRKILREDQEEQNEGTVILDEEHEEQEEEEEEEEGGKECLREEQLLNNTRQQR